MRMVEQYTIATKLETLTNNQAFWQAQNSAASVTLNNSWHQASWSPLRLCQNMKIVRKYMRWIPTDQSQNLTLKDVSQL